MSRAAVVVLSMALLSTATTGALSACDSSSSTDDEPANTTAFLKAVADDTHYLSGVDYSAVSDRDLLAAGEDVCAQLAKVDGTADGIDLENATSQLVAEYDLGRAKPKPGAEQDPGIPLRNADVRLASAIGSAALLHICPDQPFNSAR